VVAVAVTLTSRSMTPRRFFGPYREAVQLNFVLVLILLIL